jgi:hypothetical protein
MRSRRPAITAIELVLLAVVFMILVGLLLKGIQRTRESSARLSLASRSCTHDAAFSVPAAQAMWEVPLLTCVRSSPTLLIRAWKEL